MEQSIKRTSYMKQVDLPFGYWTWDGQEMATWDWALTYNPMQWPEPAPPLVGHYWAFVCDHGYFYATEKMSHPFTKGFALRMDPQGLDKATCPIIPTAEEAKEREPLFRKYVDDFVVRFDELWGDFRHKGKVGRHLREIQELFARIGTFNSETWAYDLDKFSASLERLSNGDLFNLLFDVLNALRRIWEIHFEIMYVATTVYLAFEGLVMELFGFNDTDPRFQKLIQGFDNKLYECDRELWRLAHLAADLGLTHTFKEVPEGELLSKLGETVNGREWLGGLPQFLAFYGGRSPVPMNLYRRIWAEDPTPVLVLVRDYLIRGLIDYDAERKKTSEERERTEAEFSEKVPEARKEQFKGLLKAAQTCYCWNEDHNYWIEQLGFSTLRYVILELGKRWHKAGAIADPDDIWFINTDEIKATFYPAIYGKYDFRDFVRHRRAAYNAALSRTPPPRVTGTWVRDEVRDPVMIKIFGLGPMAVPAEKVDVFGYPGAPGVVEGIARLVTDFGEFYRVEPGSIMITGSTGPAWTPIFSKLKGVVTDHGGTLSHAAIVSREYGIPAVVGTVNATRKIRDGQRIRLDGNKGYVWILD